MHTVSLRATAAFPYAGRALVAGDTFEASEPHARLLKLIGKAADATGEPVVRMVALRDFERVSAGERYAAGEVFDAHDVEAIGLERYGKAEPAPEDDAQPAKGGKRRYRRRDLRAED